MSEKDLDFRATKDIDMVLIIEALSKEFAKVLVSLMSSFILIPQIDSVARNNRTLFLEIKLSSILNSFISIGFKSIDVHNKI